MNQVSNRINALTESATIAMASKARELKEKGVDVISLSLGEPDFKTPMHVQEAAKKAIDSQEYFTYPPLNGFPELKKAIIEKLTRDNKIPCAPDNILVSNGAKHSISNVFLALLNPGDEVIIYSPYWVSYIEMVKLAEGTPVIIEGSLDDNFKATADQLKDAITDKTKAVIFSSPCNPTGAVFSDEEIKAMADVLKDRKGIYVIADEIYEYINFTDNKLSIGSIPEMVENTITVNGVSKGYAMTGWRVGYICAPAWVVKACSKLQSQTTSGVNGIAQRAALAAIAGDQSPTKEMAEAYERRRKIVYDLLKDIPGLKTSFPDGAFYFFPDVSAYFGKSFEGKTINDAGELALYILSEAHVSTVTGDAFGAPNNLRLSYAASEKDLVEALKRIKDALTKLV